MCGHLVPGGVGLPVLVEHRTEMFSDGLVEGSVWVPEVVGARPRPRVSERPCPCFSGLLGTAAPMADLIGHLLFVGPVSVFMWGAA